VERPGGRLGRFAQRALPLVFAALALGLAGATGVSGAQGVETRATGIRSGVYRGMLGEKQIELRIARQTEIEESVEGSYIVFGEPDTIAVVGEFEGPEFVLEESHNGVDVSGAWSGRIDGDRLYGNWSNGDDSVQLSFDLRRIAALAKP
jgi:hypothetical protein